MAAPRLPLISGACAQAVALVLKRHALRAGLDPAEVAGHSLRAGLATSAAAAGVPERVRTTLSTRQAGGVTTTR